MTWKVDYEPHVKAEIKKQLADGTLTQVDLRAIAKWVNEIESHGLNHVQTAYWNGSSGNGYPQLQEIGRLYAFV